MSKIAIKGNESGTATFTIEAPATNTDRIFELPDEAGKILTDVGVPTSAMPAGSVIQVVQTVKTDVFSASVTQGVSTAVTGLSVNITPSSSNSKILVMLAVSAATGNTTTSATEPGFTYIRLKRGATNLGLGTGGDYQVTAGIAGITDISRSGAESRVPNTGSYTFLDSPSTTSQITYQVEIGQTRGPSNLIYVNRANANEGRTSSTITVMEIAG